MINGKTQVLHVIKSLGRGGAEVLLAESIRLHDKDRFEFHCVYFLPWKNQMVDPIIAAGARVTCFSASNNLLLLLKYWSVLNYVRSNSIDVVHCHLPWAGFLGRLLYRFASLKVLYTEHNKQERYHWLTRTINKLTFDSQSTAIAVSSDVARSIKTNIRPSVSVVTILNGVDTQRFQKDRAVGDALKASLGIPSDTVIVGTASVFRVQKRLPEWLKVFASLPPRGVYGVVIGDGPLKERVAETLRTLNLQDRVIMPGLQQDILPWLCMIDVFMMTSVFEGMPVALLEAMSASCAICTTDAGGIKEIIVDGTNGFIVPVDEWQKLEGPLKSLVDDPSLREQLANSARQTILSNFAMSKMVVSLEEIYTAAVTGRKTV